MCALDSNTISLPPNSFSPLSLPLFLYLSFRLILAINLDKSNILIFRNVGENGSFGNSSLKM